MTERVIGTYRDWRITLNDTLRGHNFFGMLCVSVRGREYGYTDYIKVGTETEKFGLLDRLFRAESDRAYTISDALEKAKQLADEYDEKHQSHEEFIDGQVAVAKEYLNL